MPRLCIITGKKTVSGHRVSHANNKTKRKFKVNLHTISLYSELLKRKVKIRVSSSGLRTIDKLGFDQAMLKRGYHG